MGIEKKGQPDHKFQYNGVEKEKTFGLMWNETEFRSYDLQLGRWHQIDPKTSERESPYVGMGNNPIIFSDKLGDTVRVNISDEIIGYNFQRVIGTRDIIMVPLYKLTITNTEEGENYKKEFAVSRDAWVYTGKKDKNGNKKVVNTAFDPKKGKSNQYILGKIPNYAKDGSDAYKLFQDSGLGLAQEIFARPNKDALSRSKGGYGERIKEDVAQGVMIHIGGTMDLGNFLFSQDYTTASFGCFGVSCNYETSSGRYSNSIYQSFAKELENRTDGSSIELTIDRRAVMIQRQLIDKNNLPVENSQEYIFAPSGSPKNKLSIMKKLKTLAFVITCYFTLISCDSVPNAKWILVGNIESDLEAGECLWSADIIDSDMKSLVGKNCIIKSRNLGQQIPSSLTALVGKNRIKLNGNFKLLECNHAVRGVESKIAFVYDNYKPNCPIFHYNMNEESVKIDSCENSF